MLGTVLTTKGSTVGKTDLDLCHFEASSLLGETDISQTIPELHELLLIMQRNKVLRQGIPRKL